MKRELPESLIKLVESFGGRLVTDQTQVASTEIIVGVSFCHASNPSSPLLLAFTFLDPAKRGEFRDAICRASGDPALFEPWMPSEYISEPAANFFSRFPGGEGSSGPAQPAMTAFKVKEKDG